MKIKYVSEIILQLFTVLCFLVAINSLSDAHLSGINCNNERVFFKTKHGDLAVYCSLLKATIFTNYEENKTLFYPEQYIELKKQDILPVGSFFYKFWPRIFYICLYPMQVEAMEYDFEISPDLLNDILMYDFFKIEFGNKTFFAYKGSDFEENDEWGIFSCYTDGHSYVFTLPFAKGVNLTGKSSF